jgi:hypothetical protein
VDVRAGQDTEARENTFRLCQGSKPGGSVYILTLCWLSQTSSCCCVGSFHKCDTTNPKLFPNLLCITTMIDL